MLSDLRALLGSLDDLDIIEIGGGYGGQCFVTSVVHSPKSYTLVDLEPCLALQKHLSVSSGSATFATCAATTFSRE